jgi:DNA-binding beta-propeller fold protein YncE
MKKESQLHTMKNILSAAVLASLLFLGGAHLAAQSAKAASEKPPDLVWPVPPDKPRIRFLEQFDSNFDVEPRKKRTWVDKLVGNPDPNVTELFEKAAGAAIDSRNRILIAAMQKGTVYILDPPKHTVLRVRGDRGVQFKLPLGLAVEKSGNFYVSDPALKIVMKFDPEGRLLAALGQDPKLENPTYLAVDEPRNRLFVVDSHRHQVLVYSLDSLKLMATVGQRGEKNGQFNFPVGIGVSRDGSFAVSDTGSCSVQVFSPDFKFVRRIGSQGTRPGQFTRPKGVAYDSQGHLYVVDAAFNNFQIFDDKGRVLMFVGNFGNKPGEFDLPSGISIDPKDRIIVSDQLNSRVQIFQFLGGD